MMNMRQSTGRKGDGFSLPFLLAVSLLVFFISVGVAGAVKVKPSLVDLVAANSSTNLILYGRVENAISPEMEKAIKNGIPASFTFEVKLLREVRDWPDRELINISFDHQLTYDNLKDEYRVTLGEEGGRTVVVKTFARAREVMVGIDGVKVLGLSGLKRGETYAVWVKARLERATLPLYFHYLIPFWGVWDLKTDWGHVKFRY